MEVDGNGKRFNQGKTRYELIPAFAQEQYARVMTKGAEKYGDNNWKRGMKWTVVLASLERHLSAIKSGEDYDKESGLLHSAHIMANAGFITEYYKIYPEGDDRDVSWKNRRFSIHTSVIKICDITQFSRPWVKFDDEMPDKKNIVIVGDYDLFVKLSGHYCCFLLDIEFKHKSLGYRRISNLQELY